MITLGTSKGKDNTVKSKSFKNIGILLYTNNTVSEQTEFMVNLAKNQMLECCGQL
jgi:hypothetical protein